MKSILVLQKSFSSSKTESRKLICRPLIQGIYGLKKSEQTSQLTNYSSAAHSEVKKVKYLQIRTGEHFVK